MRTVAVGDHESDPSNPRLPLFLVTLTDESSAWYDFTESVLVAAPTPFRARVLASNASGDEGMAVWLEPATSKVRRVAPVSIYKTPQVVIRNFVSG
jgi:hypothetical protein